MTSLIMNYLHMGFLRLCARPSSSHHICLQSLILPECYSALIRYDTELLSSSHQLPLTFTHSNQRSLTNHRGSSITALPYTPLNLILFSIALINAIVLYPTIRFPNQCCWFNVDGKSQCISLIGHALIRSRLEFLTTPTLWSKSLCHT